MNDLVNKLLETGILIGSRQWGGDHINSDYDVVFSDKVIMNILAYFDKVGIKYNRLEGSSQSETNRMYNHLNIKVDLDGMIFNFITYPEKDINKIFHLNDYMQYIRELPIGQACAADKKVRIHVVESYLDFAFNKINPNTLEEDLGMPQIDIDEDEIPLGAMWDGGDCR